MNPDLCSERPVLTAIYYSKLLLNTKLAVTLYFSDDTLLLNTHGHLLYRQWYLNLHHSSYDSTFSWKSKIRSKKIYNNSKPMPQATPYGVVSRVPVFNISLH
jgi:hypothetical protein